MENPASKLPRVRVKRISLLKLNQYNFRDPYNYVAALACGHAVLLGHASDARTDTHLCALCAERTRDAHAATSLALPPAPGAPPAPKGPVKQQGLAHPPGVFATAMTMVFDQSYRQDYVAAKVGVSPGTIRGWIKYVNKLETRPVGGAAWLRHAEERERRIQANHSSERLAKVRSKIGKEGPPRAESGLSHQGRVMKFYGEQRKAPPEPRTDGELLRAAQSPMGEILAELRKLNSRVEAVEEAATRPSPASVMGAAIDSRAQEILDAHLARHRQVRSTDEAFPGMGQGIEPDGSNRPAASPRAENALGDEPWEDDPGARAGDGEVGDSPRAENASEAQDPDTSTAGS